MLRFALICFLSGAAFAQQKAFEAASVRHADLATPPEQEGRIRGGPGTEDPGRVTFTAVSFRRLLTKAYDLPADQIAGPAWIDGDELEDCYTITATLTPGTSVPEYRAMLQDLVVRRFGLSAHREMRNFAGYDLVNIGAKMRAVPKESTPRETTHIDPGAGERAIPDLRAGVYSMMLTPPLGKWGLFRTRYHTSMSDFAKHLRALVNYSSGTSGAAAQPRIADHTGLDGDYEFTLEFAGAMAIGQSDADVAGAAGGPTLMAALEKQLGLRLVKSNGLHFEVLVVDRADRNPLAN